MPEGDDRHRPANQPRLLIADEPTNAMEPTTQAQIIRLLTRLNQNNNTTILLISHDLQMLSKWADKINVMYCGQTVESGPSEELITLPHHPYTRALIRAIPDFGSAMPHKSRLNTLHGAIRCWSSCLSAVGWGRAARTPSGSVSKRRVLPGRATICTPVISR